MSKMNQIVAVEKGRKNDAERAFTKIYQSLGNDGALSGLTRRYQPREENGETLPPEATKVQYGVEDKLSELSDVLQDWVNVTATKDYGNTLASADVKVDDQVILEAVPATHLLFLEKLLSNLHTVFSKLPLLDPAVNWTEDDTSGHYRSDPVVTTRTRKVPKAHVLYEATDKHPAQVQAFTVDEIVGDWTTTKFSGAVTKARRDELVAKVNTLLRAVKYAREDANNTIVDDKNIGATVMEFLLA